jgi:hypothetical protein
MSKLSDELSVAQRDLLHFSDARGNKRYLNMAKAYNFVGTHTDLLLSILSKMTIEALGDTNGKDE